MIQPVPRGADVPIMAAGVLARRGMGCALKVKVLTIVAHEVDVIRGVIVVGRGLSFGPLTCLFFNRQRWKRLCAERDFAHTSKDQTYREVCGVGAMERFVTRVAW